MQYLCVNLMQISCVNRHAVLTACSDEILRRTKMAEFDDDIGTEETPNDGLAHRRTGGRSARNRQAVLQATLESLAELGLEGLTFREIGRRAGVDGTSVQRRWGSRENVLLEAIVTFANQTIDVPNTGSLRDDIIAFSKSLSSYF